MKISPDRSLEAALQEGRIPWLGGVSFLMRPDQFVLKQRLQLGPQISSVKGMIAPRNSPSCVPLG